MRQRSSSDLSVSVCLSLSLSICLSVCLSTYLIYMYLIYIIYLFNLSISLFHFLSPFFLILSIRSLCASLVVSLLTVRFLSHCMATTCFHAVTAVNRNLNSGRVVGGSRGGVGEWKWRRMGFSRYRIMWRRSGGRGVRKR